jgi:hypothetical protein
MTNMRTKFMALYRALESARDDLKELVKDTNSEATFGEHDAVTRAEAALFENRPLADWESAENASVDTKS